MMTVERNSFRTAAARLYGNDILVERASRLANLATWIAGQPEFAEVACNRRAVEAAAWVADAWCGVDVREGRLNPLLVAIDLPEEADLVRGADAAFEALRGAVDDPTRTLAAAALRACGQRRPNLAEAKILREAIHLDSFGAVWLTAQIARAGIEGRSLSSLIESWDRQLEYRYWPKRIEESLSLAATRRLARERCERIESFIAALRAQLGDDCETAGR